MKFPNIEAGRIKKRKSREELSKELGISTRTYSNWLHGKTPIPSTALIRLSVILGESIDNLLETKN